MVDSSHHPVNAANQKTFPLPRTARLTNSAFMPSETIGALLTLQLRDMEADGLSRDLDAWPKRQADLERESADVDQKLLSRRSRLRELETRRDAMELETRSNEEKSRRMRLQQLEVKKNEEYQALEHEIAALAEKSDMIETEELEILEEIDQAGIEFKTYEAEAAHEKAALAAKMSSLQAVRQEKEAALTEARQKSAAARNSLPADLLTRYDQLCRELRFPVVVPLVKQTCTGCRLRVSNKAESQANQKEFAICDNCGRIIYIE